MAFIYTSADYDPDHNSFRQRVNLSSECWSCLNNDVIVFSNSSQTLTLSGLMNRIIINFPKTAMSAISLRLEEYARSCKELFNDRIKSKRDIQLLCEAKKNELLSAPYINKKKGTAKNLRLDKKAFEYIKNNCNEDVCYNNCLADYLHALFEEYSLLPESDREQVIFADKKQKIDDAIALGNALSLKTGDTKYTLLPYKLINSPANGHCYLVGISLKGNEFSKPVSLRFTRIENPERIKDKILPLSKEQKKALDKRLLENDPAFFVSEPSEVKVRFTKEGIALLSYITKNRPKCINDAQNENGTYEKTFLCSEYQAGVYFKAFGAEATVLSPESLRRELKKHFEKAAKGYK